jgi:acyl-CoA dehydrogenase
METMDSGATSDLQAFRLEVRAWLNSNCPPEMCEPTQGEDDICWGGRRWTFKSPAQRLWLRRMADKGWTVPGWPTQYGGGGLNRPQEIVLREEMQRIGARSPVDSFGISMLGPALLRYGDEEQKLRHLPGIARGEIRWCQGYSEPNAGSNLAALQTRAEDTGHHFLVSGQKIWTSFADQADWIFCLVRTDPDAVKQAGISFLLFDMRSPGVSTKPIQLISGKSRFCEVFFDTVSVPKENLVGELNRGWDIAKYLLTQERQMIGGGGTAKGALARKTLGELAIELLGAEPSGQLADPLLRAEIAHAEIDALCVDWTTTRLRDEAYQGVEVGAQSSVTKYAGAEVRKRRQELLMACGGFDTLALQMKGNLDPSAVEWLTSKATSIEGGTSEVMLNIIAKNLLGLAGG